MVCASILLALACIVAQAFMSERCQYHLLGRKPEACTPGASSNLASGAVFEMHCPQMESQS